ncbi:hypothetical protein BDE36_1133 [Arcticibacter tournemirensis]|uniref:Uncharacterized protein n=1 Tax=Arcticibacter tournemirensis TaxID=699437 RepID=A0A5M9H9U6_9SPHI|nr:hypothetical protein [Arcticibacter tournemirensis]KAA8482024.1 hypothetical protein F1649_12845 [Arcticibacter tournemirensis]TQM49428.1 hypothetical protein BDE36_1133 [Arcticibacter tournemirensis]
MNIKRAVQFKVKGLLTIFLNMVFKKAIFLKKGDLIKKSYHLCEVPELLNRLVYKDQQWNYVKTMGVGCMKAFWGIKGSITDNVCVNNKATFQEDKIIFRTEGLNDDWIYCYTPDLLIENFVLSLDVTIYSVFTELQFAFRHKDFYNRYRFRTIDNKLLVFEIVHRGQFYTNLKTVPCSLDLGRKHSINVIAEGNRFEFVLDDVVLLSLQLEYSPFKKGGIAFILWDETGPSSISAKFENIKLSEIKGVNEVVEN